MSGRNYALNYIEKNTRKDLSLWASLVIEWNAVGSIGEIVQIVFWFFFECLGGLVGLTLWANNLSIASGDAYNNCNPNSPETPGTIEFFGLTLNYTSRANCPTDIIVFYQNVGAGVFNLVWSLLELYNMWAMWAVITEYWPMEPQDNAPGVF